MIYLVGYDIIYGKKRCYKYDLLNRKPMCIEKCGTLAILANSHFSKDYYNIRKAFY